MGTIIPSTYKAQVGTRHQFTWNETSEEIGGYIIQTYPNPPPLSGPGVVLIGRGFNQLTDTVTVPVGGVQFSLYRESDNQTQAFNFPAGTPTIQSIINTINGAFPAPAIAYPSFPLGAAGKIALVDKKPLVGNAGIRVLLSLTNDVMRNTAAEFLGISWGWRSTSQTANPTFTLMEDTGAALDTYKVSSLYPIPQGADTISLLLRYVTYPGIDPLLIILWSDGQAPFNGTTGSINLNTATGLGPIKTIPDFGYTETLTDPTLSNTNTLTVNGLTGFLVKPPFPGGWVVDPAYPAQPIITPWENRVLQFKPPPGATGMRIVPLAPVIDSNLYALRPGLTAQLQAYAWASRQGAV